MKNLYIITVIEEYELLEQHAYKTENIAHKNFDRLCKQYFETYSEDYINYQNTDKWWSDDTRIKVFIETVSINI